MSEQLKPEFERISADFTEALNKGASQFNLYKSLLEKTGSKSFAEQAFKEGAVWNDQALNLAQQFKELMGFDIDVNASDASAKHYLVDIKGSQQAYDLWKQITELVHGEYTSALNDAAEILANNLTYQERLVKAENEYAEAVRKANGLGGEQGERLKRIASQDFNKKKEKINLDQTTNSMNYAKFFSKSIEQSKKSLEKYAEFLKKQLSEALKAGAITAEEYAQKIDEINARMNNLDGNNYQFAGGGLNGIVDSMKAKGQQQKKDGQDKYDTAKQAYDAAKAAGDLDKMAESSNAMAAGESMMNGGSELMAGADQMAGAISMIDTIIHGINDIVQGLNDTFQDLKETAEALGHDTSTDDWTDANSFFTGFSSASQSATNGWDSLKNGNIGGVISGVVGSFTGWIKAFAAGHDAKLDNQIKIAERQEQLMKNISSNISTAVENTLGGIYNYKTSDYTKSQLENVKSDYERRAALEAELNGTSRSETAQSVAKGVALGSFGGDIGGLIGGITGLFSSKRKKLQKEINKIADYGDDTYEQTKKALSSGTAYDEQLASLMAQRDLLRQKRDAEDSKKDKDDSKIDDYNNQIEEMRLKIESFAQDFLKDIYSIDMKSWASDLTDAVVSAWENGENAVDAYREKVKDMVKDVTKSIVSQKILETALKEPLKYLTGLLEKKGQLDETDMAELAKQLYDVGDTVVPQIVGIFEALKNQGWDLRENGSSSTTNSIKSITEDTADLLASYVNSIRLDVSVNREQIKIISDAVKSVPELSVTARSQLTAMNQLVSLAEYRNGRLDDMYSWMRSVTSGTGTKSIKMA